MTQRIQCEMLRAAHWTGNVWLLYHDVLQTLTVLCIALPERFTYLGSSVFFTPAALCRERERVKMMSGGRRLALIINHLVPLSSAFRLLLVS